MSIPLPLTVLSTVDPVLRETTTMSILVDMPTAVALSYAMEPAAIRRTVTDITGVLETDRTPLEHVCPNCAMHEDIVATLLKLADLDRWTACVLALPVGAEPVAITQALSSDDGVPVASRVLVTSAASVIDLSRLETDIFGEDLLDERGVALSPSDRRAVSEALSHQIEYADVVIATNPPHHAARAIELLDHLQAPGTLRLADLHTVDAGRLFDHHRDGERAAQRVDPRHVEPCRGDGRHFWTLDLRSSRPFHPDRLMRHLEQLGGGRIRARGRFWLPTRPDTVCAWDGAGGQLSIGDVGAWAGTTRSTRLVMTGSGADRARLRNAFARVVLDDAEMARDVAQWTTVDDGFDPWLGSRSTSG